MPPKQRITREMILERSFAMFCQEGMGAVNARSVAKALNCSTQPIFSYFSGMDDLKNALDQKARDEFEQMAAQNADKEHVLESCCTAYVRFASEQPCLFAHMFMDINAGMTTFGNGLVREPIVEAEAAQSGLDKEKARAVCEELWLFVHGMASMQASGRTSYSKEQEKNMISGVHEALLAKAKF